MTSEAGIRKWNWHSSPETASARAVSILAFAESLAATGLYLWIMLAFGTAHLTLSACIAPFLLLRTPESTELGLRLGLPVLNRLWKLALRLHNWSDDATGCLLFPFACAAFALTMPVAILVSAALVIAVRTLSVVVTSVRYPLKSISAIPGNWWRVVMCVDSYHPPEALPGIFAVRDRAIPEKYRHAFNMMIPASTYETVREIYGQQADIGTHRTDTAIFTVVTFIPCLLYRWSLKGSSLVYSPLIWIVRSAFSRDTIGRLDDICNLAVYRLMRIYSLAVLAFLLSKLILVSFWCRVASLLDESSGGRLLSAFLVPLALPRWQIASGLNALLAWALYLFADTAYRRYRRNGPSNLRGAVSTLNVLYILRGILSVYTIVVTIYIAASLVNQFGLPPIGTEWFPWK